MFIFTSLSFSLFLVYPNPSFNKENHTTIWDHITIRHKRSSVHSMKNWRDTWMNVSWFIILSHGFFSSGIFLYRSRDEGCFWGIVAIKFRDCVTAFFKLTMNFATSLNKSELWSLSNSYCYKTFYLLIVLAT